MIYMTKIYFICQFKRFIWQIYIFFNDLYDKNKFYLSILTIYLAKNICQKF